MTENKRKKRSSLRLIAICGIFSALVIIGTELRIPTAIGHINLGDAVILMASYFIGPASFFPAAIGSALGDLIAGYPHYIVPSFVIKGLMGLISALIMSRSHVGSIKGFIVRLAGALSAELIMIGGYFAFESLMYGMESALGSVVFNLIQAVVAIVCAMPLTYVIKTKKITGRLK